MARPVRLAVPNLTFTEDYTLLDKLTSELKYLNTMHIEYGIVNNDKYPSDDPRGRAGHFVAEVMKRHEYGLNTAGLGKTVDLPPRPLFAQSLVKGKIEGSTYLTWIALQWGHGAFSRDMLHTVAKKMPETIKQELAEQNFFPNSPVTIEQKSGGVGDDTILYDTGVLYNSFDGKVKRGNILRNTGTP